MKFSDNIEDAIKRDVEDIVKNFRKFAFHPKWTENLIEFKGMEEVEQLKVYDEIMKRFKSKV